MKMHFTELTQSIGDTKSQIVLILTDDTLTWHEKKIQINRIRMSVMSRFSYYSTEMKMIDDFIRQQVEKLDSKRQQSASVIAS